MPTAALNQEIHSLTPSSVVDLFVLEIPGEAPIRFHPGSNKLRQAVIWRGDGSLDPNSVDNLAATYTFFPIEFSGYEVSSEGMMPQPTMRVANLNGSISALILRYGDLVGSKLTRKRTLYKFLDPINFPSQVNPDHDPNAEYPSEIFFVEQKTLENDLIAEFKLSSSLDVAGVKLPYRQILANLCMWEYRKSECAVAGGRVQGIIKLNPADAIWNSVTAYIIDDIVTYGGLWWRCTTANTNQRPDLFPGSWKIDVCEKTLDECKLRQSVDAQSSLTYGGFPGASRFPDLIA